MAAGNLVAPGGLRGSGFIAPEAQFVLPDNSSEFSKGLRSALGQASAGTSALQALVNEKLARDAEAQAAREEALRAAASVATYSPRIHSYDKAKTPGDVYDYVTGAIGQGIGSTIPSLAAAYALRLGAPGSMLRRATAGLGAYGGAFPQEAGETALYTLTDPAAAAQPINQRLQTVGAKGAVNSLLEAAVPAAIASRGGAGLVRGMRGVGATLGQDAFTEGVTETLQEKTGQMAMSQLNPERDISGDPAARRNAAIVGALGGAGISAGPTMLDASLQAATEPLGRKIAEFKERQQPIEIGTLFQKTRSAAAGIKLADWLGNTTDRVPPDVAAQGPEATAAWQEQEDARKSQAVQTLAERIAASKAGQAPGMQEQLKQWMEDPTNPDHWLAASVLLKTEALGQRTRELGRTFLDKVSDLTDRLKDKLPKEEGQKSSVQTSFDKAMEGVIRNYAPEGVDLSPELMEGIKYFAKVLYGREHSDGRRIGIPSEITDLFGENAVPMLVNVGNAYQRLPADKAEKSMPFDVSQENRRLNVRRMGRTVAEHVVRRALPENHGLSDGDVSDLASLLSGHVLDGVTPRVVTRGKNEAAADYDRRNTQAFDKLVRRHFGDKTDTMLARLGKLYTEAKAYEEEVANKVQQSIAESDEEATKAGRTELASLLSDLGLDNVQEGPKTNAANEDETLSDVKHTGGIIERRSPAASFFMGTNSLPVNAAYNPEYKEKILKAAQAAHPGAQVQVVMATEYARELGMEPKALAKQLGWKSAKKNGDVASFLEQHMVYRVSGEQADSTAISKSDLRGAQAKNEEVRGMRSPVIRITTVEQTDEGPRPQTIRYSPNRLINLVARRIGESNLPEFSNQSERYGYLLRYAIAEIMGQDDNARLVPPKPDDTIYIEKGGKRYTWEMATKSYGARQLTSVGKTKLNAISQRIQQMTEAADRAKEGMPPPLMAEVAEWFYERAYHRSGLPITAFLADVDAREDPGISDRRRVAAVARNLMHEVLDALQESTKPNAQLIYQETIDKLGLEEERMRRERTRQSQEEAQRDEVQLGMKPGDVKESSYGSVPKKERDPSGYRYETREVTTTKTEPKPAKFGTRANRPAEGFTETMQAAGVAPEEAAQLADEGRQRVEGGVAASSTLAEETRPGERNVEDTGEPLNKRDVRVRGPGYDEALREVTRLLAAKENFEEKLLDAQEAGDKQAIADAASVLAAIERRLPAADARLAAYEREPSAPIAETAFKRGSQRARGEKKDAKFSRVKTGASKPVTKAELDAAHKQNQWGKIEWGEGDRWAGMWDEMEVVKLPDGRYQAVDGVTGERVAPPVATLREAQDYWNRQTAEISKRGPVKADPDIPFSQMNVGDEANRLTPEQMDEIADYVMKNLPDAITVDFPLAKKFSGKFAKQIISVSLYALDHMGVAFHESMHALMSLVDPRVKDVLLKAANSGVVRRQLETLLKDEPDALNDMRTDPEERIAYMFQFWAKGQLRLGSESQGIFARIARTIRRVLHWVSNDERAQEIMAAFHGGKLKDPIEALAYAPGEAERNWTRVGEKVGRVLEAVFSTGDARLRRMGIPAIDEIVNLIGKPATQAGTDEGYVKARSRVAGQFISEFNNLLVDGEVSEINLARALEELQREVPDDQVVEKGIVLPIRKLMRKLRNYIVESGLNMGDRGPLYFTRVWDEEKVASEDFITMLMENYPNELDAVVKEAGGNPRWAAETIQKAIAGNPMEFSDPIEDERDVGYTPLMRSLKKRTLGFISGEHAAPFLQKDLVKTVSSYIAQAVRRAEYSKRFGPNGEILKALQGQAKDQGATEEQLKTVGRYIMAAEGTLGHDIDPALRDAMGWIMVYQNLRLLPLSIFSQMIDPMGILVRGGTIGDAWNAYKLGAKEIVNTFRGGKNKDDLVKLAETLGIVEQNALLEMMGQMYSSVYMYGLKKQINEAIFRWNMMEGWTRGIRAGAAGAAINFLESMRDSDSPHVERWLSELGLTRDDIRDGVDPANPKHAQAIAMWVDGAVLRPNATERPLWASDPHYMLIFHLKQFAYSFWKTTVGRVAHEAAHGNYKPAMALAAFVPIMIASDALKGAIMTGGGEPEWKRNWTAGDYLWYGVQRAGLLGAGQFAVDYHDYGAESLFGPTVEQLGKLVRKPFSATTVMDALPLNPVYRNLLLSSGD